MEQAQTAVQPKPLISLVVPAYNEEANLAPLLQAVQKVIAPLPYRFEIIFVNDGSTDNTYEVAKTLRDKNNGLVRTVNFSRNFGKEAATTAGYLEARGDAVMAIDADLQHPPELIPTFIKKWHEDKIDVVIGVRNNTASDTIIKRFGSRWYYSIMNAMSETPIVPRATDFRLLDRQVVDAFTELSERNRMTRGLIDWLGFRRDYIYFDAPERLHGVAAYSLWKLVKLAAESFISHSLFPLRLAGYLGIVITFLSGIFGIVMMIDRWSALGLNFTGPAILANIILFLVGIMLIMLGLLSYYIAHIYTETQNRPLYVIRDPRV